MGKKKKKNKNSALYNAIKPIIKDNRVLWSIVGATAVGVGLASLFGTEKGKEIVDKISSAASNLQIPGVTNGAKNTVSKKQPVA